MTTPTKGDPWFQTYNGKRFYPLAPRSEDVCIGDIAHALANVCRFGGHCTKFYSVAQHSVLVSEHLPPEFALAGLLHDATEAYLGDMVRPLKLQMPSYQFAEAGVEEAIFAAFGILLTPEAHLAIKTEDNRALMTERRDLLTATGYEWSGLEHFPPYPERLHPWDPIQAEHRFLDLYCGLTTQTS